MPNINFTPEKVRELQAAHDAAVDAGKDEFLFEGHAVLVAYAKYLLEYLATQFAPGP
jgi:hypothetical protein